MNVVKENIDELNAVIKVKIDKEDYESKVNEVLKDYRKKARIDGFRPGKVPFGMIKKMYYKPVLLDEVNKVVLDGLYNYIKEENLQVLGEPLPSEKEQKSLDFDNDTEFDFAFDVGLAPEFELKLSGKDKVPYYTIKIDDKTIDKTIEKYAQRLGSFKSVEISDEQSYVKGTITEMDEIGQKKDGGVSVDDASIAIDVIKDDKIKKQFLNKKSGDTVRFDLKKALPNDTEISSLLKINKEEVPGISDLFNIEIKEISNFEKAEINQDLYDKIYGKDEIKSDEEFKGRIAEDLKKGFAQDSDYRFKIDAKEVLLRKYSLNLPAEFLKRWLITVNKEKYTSEDIEKEFPNFEEDLKWQLIRNKIVKMNDIQVSEQEAIEQAKQYAMMQFRQYGINDLPEEHLNNYVNEMMKKEEERKKIYDMKSEEKVFEFLKENMKVDNKEVTLDKFNKLFENKK